MEGVIPSSSLNMMQSDSGSISRKRQGDRKKQGIKTSTVFPKLLLAVIITELHFA